MNNFIEIHKNALSGDICDSLVKIFEDNINKAKPGKVGGGQLKPEIKSTLDLSLLYNGVLNKDGVNEILSPMLDVLKEKIKEYFIKHQIYTASDNIESNNFEQECIWDRYVIHHGCGHLKRYVPGKDYYHWHVDTSSYSPATFTRKLVMMFYLNDVKEGGETEFYNQQVSAKPTKGTLVIFPADFTGKHRGLMPKSGLKYIMNSWLLELVDPLVNYIIEKPHDYLCLNKQIMGFMKNK